VEEEDVIDELTREIEKDWVNVEVEMKEEVRRVRVVGVDVVERGGL
jgi:hypothetical protein